MTCGRNLDKVPHQPEAPARTNHDPTSLSDHLPLLSAYVPSCLPSPTQSAPSAQSAVSLLLSAKKCKKLQTVCAILRPKIPICDNLRPLFFFTTYSCETPSLNRDVHAPSTVRTNSPDAQSYQPQTTRRQKCALRPLWHRLSVGAFPRF